MQKIYIVLDKLHGGEAGGLITTYVNLTEMLKNDYHFEIVSIANSGCQTDYRFPGIRIHNVSAFDFYPSMRELNGYLSKGKYVRLLKLIGKLIVYFLYIPISRFKLRKYFEKDAVVLVSSPASAMFMPADVKFILEIHSSFDFFWKGRGLASLQIHLMQKPVRTLFRTKSDMIKACNMFNAGYVYNFCSGRDKNIELHVGKPIRHHRIIFMGRLVEAKRPLLLLEAAKLLKEKYGDFQLDVYGTGPYHDAMLEKINEYGLENNVDLKGFCSDKSIYNNYSIEWLTSSNEGFGLVIIEAKAYGVPTISTRWGEAINEVISDNQDGYIVDNIDEMVDRTIGLWENEQLLIEMSNQALNHFEKFSPDKAKENWLRILSDYSEHFLE